jgi:hypothetical protein
MLEPKISYHLHLSSYVLVYPPIWALFALTLDRCIALDQSNYQNALPNIKLYTPANSHMVYGPGRT